MKKKATPAAQTHVWTLEDQLTAMTNMEVARHQANLREYAARLTSYAQDIERAAKSEPSRIMVQTMGLASLVVEIERSATAICVFGNAASLLPRGPK